MNSKRKQAYLLKEFKNVLQYDGECKSPLLIYSANRNSFKCFPNEKYEDDIIESVSEALEQAEKGHKEGKYAYIKMSSKFDTFYDKPIITTQLNFPKDFVEKISALLPNPRVSIRGMCTTVYKDVDLSWVLYPQSEREFNIPPIELKEDATCHVFNDTTILAEYRKTYGARNVYLNCSVIIDWSEICVAVVPFNLTEKLFTEKILADCLIVAENGEEIKCHSCVLAANSDVFHTMLTNGLQESQTKQIKLDDIGEEEINTILSFCYGQELNIEKLTEEIIISLLQASHKYNIIPLEALMLQILCRKPDDWFTINNVLSLYFFSVNIDAFQILSNKMLMIMKRNPQKFRLSTSFKELLDNDTKVAAELLMNLLELGGGGDEKV